MSGDEAPPGVELDGVRFSYPDGRDALRGLDLRIGAGERVAVLGPNGAGKTTLVFHLNGVLGAHDGRVRIGGTPVTTTNLAAIRRRVGVVFQDPDDQLFMPTVSADVGFGPRNMGLDPPAVAAQVAGALAAVGMSAAGERRPHHLSFGERRRVALATVLAMGPEVLVLDEPTSNLDPASRRELSSILAGLGVTLLVVTHDLPYALELCPRSVIIDEGRIVADGPTATLLADDDLLRAHRLELPWGFDGRLLGAGRG